MLQRCKQQVCPCAGAAADDIALAAIRQAMLLPDLTEWEKESLDQLLERRLQGIPLRKCCCACTYLAYIQLVLPLLPVP